MKTLKAIERITEENTERESRLPILKLHRRGLFTRINSIALNGIFIFAVVFTLYSARALFVPLVIAAFLTLIFSPLVNKLKRFKIAESVSAFFIIAVVGISIFLLAEILSKPFMDWLQGLPANLVQIQQKFKHFFLLFFDGKTTKAVQTASDNMAQQVVAHGISLTSELLVSTPQFLVSAIGSAVLLYFLLASGEFFFIKLLRLLSPLTARVTIIEAISTIQRDLGHYFLTVTCINTGLGIVTGLIAYAFDLPTPFLWGFIAALLNFIPYLGASISLCILTIVAATTLHSFEEIIAVPLSFLVVAIVEGQIVNPILVGQRLELNPVIVLISLFFWGWMWGIAGMFIAIPILVALKVCSNHFELLKPLGEFLGRH